MCGSSSSALIAIPLPVSTPLHPTPVKSLVDSIEDKKKTTVANPSNSKRSPFIFTVPSLSPNFAAETPNEYYKSTLSNKRQKYIYNSNCHPTVNSENCKGTSNSVELLSSGGALVLIPDEISPNLMPIQLSISINNPKGSTPNKNISVNNYNECERVTQGKTIHCKPMLNYGSKRCRYDGESSKGRYCKEMTMDGRPCKIRVGVLDRRHSGYCCNKHDPNIKSTFTAELREDNVRSNKGTEVLKRRNYQDAYTLYSIPFKDSDIAHLPQYFEIDHVLELHAMGELLDQTTQDCSTNSRRKLLKKLKEAVNSLGNLAVTTKLVNKQKFDAMFEFCDDFWNDRVQGRGFVTYLKENGKLELSKKLGRNIQKEYMASYDTVVNHFDQENQLEGNFVEKLQDMTIKMKLQ